MKLKKSLDFMRETKLTGFTWFVNVARMGKINP